MVDDPVPFVLAAFRGHGRKRSKLYSWMAEHHAELSAAKKSGRRVDWVSVTSEMTALGFKAAGNKPLTTAGVRRTWHRVDADVKAGVIAPGNKKPREQPLPVPAIRVTEKSAPPSAPTTTKADDDDNPHGFKLGINPKSWD